MENNKVALNAQQQDQFTQRKSAESAVMSPTLPEIIDEVRRTPTGDVVVRRYLRGKLLGRGGFARCYEFTNLDNNKVYAGKVVVKSSLTKPKAKQKLQAEIKIHKNLAHARVVQFIHFFEDRQNAYILLELCTNQTLSELVKRRKRLTEPEAQYYMLQILEGVAYLHRNGVIHRDLKLGNLMLSQSLEVRIGDLGLAAKLTHFDERKRTICGTPNYIAPEVLEGKNGHSFQADIWSLGVILYTMLIGRPPFETADVKATYKRIRAGLYTFPPAPVVSDAARSLIQWMLQVDPSRRPSVEAVMRHTYFCGPGVRIPRSLPLSSLQTPPIFDSSGISMDFSVTPVAHNSALPYPAPLEQPLVIEAPVLPIEPVGVRRQQRGDRESAPLKENNAKLFDSAGAKAPAARARQPLGARDINAGVHSGADDPIPITTAQAASRPQAVPHFQLPLAAVAQKQHPSNSYGAPVSSVPVTIGAQLSTSREPSPSSRGDSGGARTDNLNVGGIGSGIGIGSLEGQNSCDRADGGATLPVSLNELGNGSSSVGGSAAALRSRGDRARAKALDERERAVRRRSASVGRDVERDQEHVDVPPLRGDCRCEDADRESAPLPPPAIALDGPRGKRNGYASAVSMRPPASADAVALVALGRQRGEKAGGDAPASASPYRSRQSHGLAINTAAPSIISNLSAPNSALVASRPGRSSSVGRAMPPPPVEVFAGPRVNDGGSSDSNALRPTRQVLLTAPVDARPVASSTGSGRAANPSSSSLSQPADIDSVALAAAADTDSLVTKPCGAGVKTPSKADSGASAAATTWAAPVAANLNTLQRMHRWLSLSISSKTELAQVAAGSSIAGLPPRGAGSEAVVNTLVLSEASPQASSAPISRSSLASGVGVSSSSPSDNGAIRPPDLWVVKWVDYTSKYGLGFLFNNMSCGVFFNDCTKIILSADGVHFEYLDRASSRSSYTAPPPRRDQHTLTNFPPELQKKVTLLKHFQEYLFDQQRRSPAPLFESSKGGEESQAVQAGASDVSDGNGLPFLKKWMLHKYAILFRLSNRTVQVSFFDKSEIILSSGARVVTYVSKVGERSVFALSTAMEDLRPDIAKRLKYTKEILYQLIEGGNTVSQTASGVHGGNNIAPPVAANEGLLAPPPGRGHRTSHTSGARTDV